jgi:hypothetical protein
MALRVESTFLVFSIPSAYLAWKEVRLVSDSRIGWLFQLKRRRKMAMGRGVGMWKARAFRGKMGDG